MYKRFSLALSLLVITNTNLSYATSFNAQDMSVQQKKQLSAFTRKIDTLSRVVVKEAQKHSKFRIIKRSDGYIKLSEQLLEKLPDEIHEQYRELHILLEKRKIFLQQR